MNELDLFAAAIAIADHAERAALLERECAGRPDVRQRIDQLLQAHFRSHPLLDQSIPEHTGAYVPNEQPGAVIAGRYKLLECIGEGGMGTVWVAEQTQPVRRKVAVKLIKAGMDSKNVIARFEAERQALAVMDHPNVAKVLDGGLIGPNPPEREGGAADSPSPLRGGGWGEGYGRPFFVMEYVKGVPITEYCDATRLSVPERLHLFAQVCEAVQHAHQKGIIHRDLKPSNILVAPCDDKPVPKIIDFGLAKAMHQSLTEKTLHTAHETVLGTPLYMSPEQAQLNNLDVDTRSDIYSLGVLLYELLTGTTPLEKQRFKEAAWDEVRRIIREEEPPRPSARLSSTNTLPSLAACRQSEPLKLTKQVRGDLDWIVMKALEKDRTRRYETANGFAADVLRYLSGEAVQAHPPSTAYRLKKFVRRNKGQVIAASLVFFALLAGIAGTTLGLIEARKQADLAKHNELRAELHARTSDVLAEMANKAARAAEAEKENAARAAAAEKAARDREAAQRVRAEKASDRTRQVLDAMVSGVTGDSLSTQKEITAEQKKFLTEVLSYYREFAGEKADDEKARYRTANAAFRVGMIEGRLGRNAEGIVACQMALDGYQTLAADFPAVPVYRQNLANSRINLGRLLGELGRREEQGEQYRQALVVLERLVVEFPAVLSYRNTLAHLHNNLAAMLSESGQQKEAEVQIHKGLAIQESLVALSPNVPEYRDTLARIHQNLAVVLKDLGQRSEAEVQIRKVLAIQESLVVLSPNVPQYRAELARSRDLLASLLSDQGRRKEAEEQFRQSLAVQEKLAASYPADPKYRVALARKHNSLGMLLGNMGQPKEAEEQFRMGLAIQEKLVADFPTVPEYQVSLGGYCCNLGILARDSGKPAESLAWFQKAITTLLPMHEAEPHAMMAKRYLLNSHWGRAIAHERLGRSADAASDWGRAFDLIPKAQQPQYQVFRARAKLDVGLTAEAVAEVAELTKSSGWNAGQWYEFACVYAIAAGKLADKKAEYADRAMELLHKAVKAGYKDVAHMKKDTDLDPLRDREDFKKLLVDLDANSPTTKNIAPTPPEKK